MSNDIKLVVDVMSGDIAPRLCVIACTKFIESHSGAHLILVGDKSLVESAVPQSHSQISVVHTNESVSMTDSPVTALRHKKNSSMYKAIELLAAKQAHAGVSAGNTGAMLAIGSHFLGRIKGVTRPAIVKAIPTIKGTCVMLDLGANVDCSAEQLVEFACMGAAFAESEGVVSPSVALLSNGHESSKGNKALRAASIILTKHKSLNFKGYIEGDALFNCPADVVVCDGFVGNVALKVSEGASRFMMGDLAARAGNSWFHWLLATLAQPFIRPWAQKFQPDNFNGAAFVGLDSVLVKSHGSASLSGFEQALNVAYKQAENQLPEKVRYHLKQLGDSPSYSP